MFTLTKVFSMAVVVAVLAVGAGACGAGGSPAADTHGVPNYKPSTVIVKTKRSATLHSPDSIDKVSEFYLHAVRTDGWNTVSESVNHFSTNLTVKKAKQGASIAISKIGSGTAISISTYPMY